MIAALVSSLLGIAAAIALDRSVDRINERWANQREVSADDIIHMVNGMIGEARQKGEDTIRKLNDRLGSIQYPLGMSSSIKEFITQQRNKLSRLTEATTQNINSVEKELGDAESRASNLSYQSPDYRRIWGKEKLKGITDQVQTAIDRMNEIQKGVEQNV